MIKPWSNPDVGVYRIYVNGWINKGGWSAVVDVIAGDEIEAQDLVLEHWSLTGLPEQEYMNVEATRVAWWIKVWLKRGEEYNIDCHRFEVRDVKEW